MTPEDILHYLHAHIPLSKAMGVEVEAADSAAVELSAPLAPNINHRETVFGGSASALAILAAWTLIYVRLRGEGLAARVVIRRNTMRYTRPSFGRFTARAVLTDVAAWERFVKILKRKKRARITIEACLYGDGEPAGRLEGEFVALELHAV